MRELTSKMISAVVKRLKRQNQPSVYGILATPSQVKRFTALGNPKSGRIA